MKPEIQARMEKAFKDAGFDVSVQVYINTIPVTTMGRNVPSHFSTSATASATIDIPEEWLEMG